MTCNAPEGIGAACNIGTGLRPFIGTQLIGAITLDNDTFTEGDPAGTVIGAIDVAMSAISPGFAGTLSLSGADAALFQLSDTSLPADLELAGTGVEGEYDVNIVATQDDRIGNSPKVQPFTITGEPASAYTGPLDIVPGAVVAYSQRAMAVAWVSNAITIKRDSDDATMSFAPTANNAVDTAAVTAFLAGANPFGAAWFDQSGSGYDLDDSEVSQPPWIASAVGGKPGFLGSGNGVNLRSGMVIPFTSGSELTVFAVVDMPVLGDAPSAFSFVYIDGNQQSNVKIELFSFYNEEGDVGAYVFAAGVSGVDSEWASNVTISAGPHLFIMRVSANGTVTASVDGTDVGMSLQFGLLLPIPTETIAFQFPYGLGGSTAVEAVAYQSLLSGPNELAISQNIAAYYGITLS